MNLVDNIEKHFKEHSDYDELTKIRYIYLYICKVFSYDTRFYSRDSKIKKDIYIIKKLMLLMLKILN